MRHVLLALVLATGTTLAAAGCGTAAAPASPPAGPETVLSGTPRPSSTATAAAGSPDGAEWEALNSYDGVVTNSFLQLPRQIGDMTRKRQESNPPDLEFHADYESDVRDAKARVLVYFARTASGPVAVKSAEDPRFTAIVAGNAQAFQGAGVRRAVKAGGLDWSCFEGSRDALTHTICVTPRYGRVVEVQYINAGRVDRLALDPFLGGVGDGVAALSK